MKRYFIALICGVLLIACGGNKTGVTEEVAPADSSQELTDSAANDSITDLLANIPMPKAADELFDDFIFNFAANQKLQMERILFPLKTTKAGQVDKIEKGEWKMERYFMRQDYYTLIFDSEKQMEVVKDTSLNHAVVEMIYFNA